MALSAVQLLTRVTALPYPARQAELVRHARGLAGTAELSTLLAEFHTAGPWERRRALQLAAITGERDYVRRCLRSAEVSLVQLAVAAAVRLGLPAEELAAVLPAMPAVVRTSLVKAVRARHAQGVADALLDPVREWFGEREAAGLLPACSAAVVERELPSLAYAVTNWAALARRHPELVLDHLDGQLDGTPQVLWPELLGRLVPAVAVVAAAHPERVLGLVERTGPHFPLSGLRRVLGMLARRDPARVHAILLAPGRGHIAGSRALWTALAVLDDDALIRLARILPTREVLSFLRALPPSRRGAVYGPLVGDRDPIAAGFPLEVLDLLPHAARHTEAARLAAARVIADDPDLALAVTARAPWADAETALRRATRRPDAEDRATAYPLLVRCAIGSRDPAVVEALLTSLDRLHNEQDPVRQPALAALATVPGWLIGPRAAQALATLVDDAVQARDCSWSTRAAVRTIGDRLVQQGALARDPGVLDAGLRVVSATAQHLSHLSLSGLDRLLPHGAEQLVFAALEPRLSADARVGRYDVALALATGLGRRAWGLDGLQRYVQDATRAKNDHEVRLAIELWLQPSATRDERVATVFRRDRSTITFDRVARAIAARRTDLLDTAFTRPLHGRFLRRRVRHLPHIGEFADRWMPHQAALYRDLLISLVDDPKASMWERTAALRDAARLPGAVEQLRRYSANDTVQLADAAIAGLAWTTEPGEVVADLAALARTDRAHVAFAALTRAARFTVPDALTTPLAHVLSGGKVTARKEVCRLLADQHVPGAAEVLVGQLGDPHQHRDVRRAAVSALRWLLDDEVTWEALTIATSDDELATAVLDVGPDWIAVRHRARYAGLVVQVAASPDPDVARAALAASPHWVRWDRDGAITTQLAELVRDLDATATWRQAAQSLVAAVAVTGVDADLREAVADLAATAATRDRAEFDAGPDRDLPARRRLDRLVQATAETAGRAPALRSSARALADIVATVPSAPDLAARFALAAVPAQGVDDAVTALRHAAQLCLRPAVAGEVAAHLRRAITPLLGGADPGVAIAIAHDVARDGSAGAMLALGVARAAAARDGWTPGLRAVVRELRDHEDPDVRLAALQVVTAAE